MQPIKISTAKIVDPEAAYQIAVASGVGYLWKVSDRELKNEIKGEVEMGLVHADITLINAIDHAMVRKGIIAEDRVKKMNVRALVDSGATMLTISDTIKNQLDLQVEDQYDVLLANGEHAKCEVVGPVKIVFKNRNTTCMAVVLPGADEVLLGVVPLECMDLVIDPLKQELALPPDRPYLARMIVK